MPFLFLLLLLQRTLYPSAIFFYYCNNNYLHNNHDCWSLGEVYILLIYPSSTRVLIYRYAHGGRCQNSSFLLLLCILLHSVSWLVLSLLSFLSFLSQLFALHFCLLFCVFHEENKYLSQKQSLYFPVSLTFLDCPTLSLRQSSLSSQLFVRPALSLSRLGYIL